MKSFHIILFLLIPLINLGQIEYSRNYTINDGLPSNTVRSIFKDSHGVLWIGTDAGLCTFNGIEFKRFPLFPENRSNKVWTIVEDDAGNLWFGTYGSGLFKYDGKNLINYKKPIIPSQYIRTLKYSSKYKCLLIGTEQGFCCYKDSVFKSFYLEPTNPEKKVQVMGFIETYKGIIYYTYQDYGFTFYPSENRVEPIPLNSPLNIKSSSSCFITSTGDTIIGVNKTGLKIISKNGVTEYTNMGQVFDIKEDKHGTIWCAAWSFTDMTEPGGFFILSEKDKMKPVSSRYKINDKLAWCIYFDNDEDVTYLGTEDNGLYVVPNKGITYFDCNYFGVNRLDIYDILEKDNNFWISAGSNLIKGKPERGFRVYNTKYFYQNSTSGYANDSEPKNNSFPKKFWDIESDENGNIWIGEENSFFKVRNAKPSFYRYNHCRVVSENFYINKAGLLMSGGWSPYFYYIPNISEKKHDTTLTDRKYPIDINRIITRDNEVWFCSFNYGLYRYKDGMYKSFAQTDSSIPTNLKDLCLDKKGNLVTGTNDGKVLIIEGNDSLKVKYELSEKEGIIGNSIIWLFCSTNNYLWVGTNTGLNVFSLDELYSKGSTTIRYFNADEGFIELSVRPVVEDSKGFIWLGGKDNLVKIDPEKLLSTPQRNSKLCFANIDVNNQEFDWKKVTTTDPWSHMPIGNVRLRYDKNSLTFRFKTTNKLNPSKDVFSVFLEGFDKDSSSWNSKHDATYTNLPPNDYKLIIKGKNICSQKAYTPLEFSFTILPPWWKTWWFYFLVFVSFSTLAWLVFVLRVKQVRKFEKQKFEFEQRLNQIRIQAIQAQMNPHFIFNAISSIQSYMLSNDIDSTTEYLNDFALMIRKTLENVSERLVTISDEIEYLNRYVKLEKLRLDGNLEYYLNISKSVNPRNTWIPPMLIQPFIENAIKHGLSPKKDDRKLWLTIEEQNGILQITIKDNGIGRKKAGEYNSKLANHHRSKGIEITKEIIKYLGNPEESHLYGVEIHDLQNGDEPSGTSVILFLPILNQPEPKTVL